MSLRDASVPEARVRQSLPAAGNLTLLPTPPAPCEPGRPVTRAGHQIVTRSDGGKYILSPGLTPNASKKPAWLRTGTVPRTAGGE